MPANPTAVFTEPGEVTVEERPVPDPEPSQVLIETERTLVSTGTELAQLVEHDETYAPGGDGVDYPVTPGYCNVGTVVEAGAEVDDEIVGQRVASYSSHAKFVVAESPAPTASGFGTYRLVPDGLPDEEAAFFTIAEIVMNGVRQGGVTWGEDIAVFGLGLLGQLTVRFCEFAGAGTVAGLDLEASRREYLPDGPRIAEFDPAVDGYLDDVEDELGDDLADVVFEVTGSPAAIPDEPEVLGDQGRLVLLGSPRGETTFDFYEHCHVPGHTIIGAHNRTHPSVASPTDQWTQERHGELFFDLVRDGDFRVGDLITHRYDAADAPDAYEMLLEDRTRALGVVFEW